jgi:hypothetical protein
MSWDRTAAIRPLEGRSESELKRMRAYESLVVLIVVIFAVVAFGGAIVVAVSSGLHGVATSLSPSA